MAKENLSVVMLPWSAFGHLSPFFQLSLALAKAKVRVSFISTPKNIQRLPKIPHELQPYIQLVPIPFPTLDSEFLTEGAEATVDLPFEKIDNLKIAYDLLQQPIKQFIEEQSPDWIITDFAAHWAVEIGKDKGIPLVYFSVVNAATCFLFSSAENKLSSANTNHDVLPSPESLTSPPDLDTVQSTVAYREHEAADMHAGLYGVNVSGISDAERHAKIISACKAFAIRSCNEFEGEYLEAYKNNTGKLVIPTGLLPPEKPKAQRENTSVHVIFDWLDKQKPKSVVFVGFGSECKLSKEQVFEIAHGLELSELPFLWALRKPGWAHSDDDALPPGFVDRTREKGLVSMGWVPQSDILGHTSIGGSLFHSGWGSVIETLQFGHVLVVLPFIIDQPLNARLLVEKGLAVEVKRRGDGSFSKDDIAKTLRHAMVEEKGEQLRINARKAAAVFGDEKLHQDYYIGEFVSFLKNNTTIVKC